MPIQKNLNVAPYYDDFDPNKNFYKVLYKPGYPIQARELTQSQTILQDQIEKLASRILREGDNVVPGEFSLQNPVPYVRLSSYTRGTDLQSYVGLEATGVTSGVVAKVEFVVDSTDTDDATLYVSYKSSGETSEYSTFVEGEVLEFNNSDSYTAVVGVNGESLPTSSNALGQGILFSVGAGSYFIDGLIVRNDEQTIVVDKYDTTAFGRVGFLVTEEIVTAAEDTSLLDNAQGTSNFAAPGADRLKVTLTLAFRSPRDVDPNFVVLAVLEQGLIVGNGEGETVKWDWLYDILARRTNDESGNYIVREFRVNPMEYITDGVVKGRFEADSNGQYPAVPGTLSDTPIDIAEATSYYALQMSAGKAYVNGYEIGYDKPFYVYGKKARDEEFLDNQLMQVTEGQSITVSNVSGIPDVQNLAGDSNTRAFDTIQLYRNFTDGYIGQGTAAGVPLNAGNSPWKTYHIICDGDLSGTLSVGGLAVTEIYKEGRSAVVNSGNPIARGTSIGGRNVLVCYEIDPIVAGLVRPRHFMADSLVDTQDGFYGYNSTFNMGLLDSVYFTEVSVVGVRGTGTNWTVGDIVTGQDSGATGVVEESSTNKLLVLSDVQGQFVVNEFIQQGSKVSRILRNGEVTGFQFTDKGTSNNIIDLSSQSAITLSTLGSSIELTVAAGDIDVSTSEITLTDLGRDKLRNFPYPEGSELNQRLNYSVTTSPGGVSGYAVTRTPIIDGSSTLTKAFYSSLADVNDFSADIAIQRSGDTTTVDLARGALFSGTANTNFLICDNFWGDPSRQLVEGDLVTFVDDQGNDVTKIVAFATKPVGYGELRSKSYIYFTTAIPANVTGKTVQSIRLKTIGEADDNFLVRLPATTVKTLEAKPTKTNISYTVFREFTVSAAIGASSVSVATTAANEQFLAFTDLNTVTVAKNVSNGTDPSNLEGRILNVAIDASQDGGKKVVYTFDSPLTDALTLKVIAPVLVTDAKAKRKIIHYNETITVAEADAQSEYISLGLPDVLNVKRITLDPGGRNVDLTKEFEFDNGQRDNIYDIAKLKRRAGRVAPNGDLEIVFDYFEHSSEGDFFSVDSYTSDQGVGFEAIPYYTSMTGFGGVANRYGSPSYVNLRDVIDFRPVVNSTGTNPSVYARITDGRSTLDSTNFLDTTNGGNGFVSRMPVPATNVTCDLSFYLPRIDSVFLDQSGAMGIIPGVASANPQPVEDISTGIRLYDIYLPAYTFSAATLKPKKYDYKRYQMKDIAKLERRIQRIEEVVTLTLLEQAALNVEVRDSVTGLDRFKNGIITDSFIDHSRGDVTSNQYRNSIDGDRGLLRSPHYTDQSELEERNNSATERRLDGYTTNNGIATLRYSEVDYISSSAATRTVNLQPYSIFVYEGRMKLEPSIDTWKDINRQPDLIIQDNSLFDAVSNMTDEINASGIGTVWNDWALQGTTVSTEQINVEAQNTENAASVQAQVDLLTAQGWNGSFEVTEGDLAGTVATVNNVNRGAIAVTSTTETSIEFRTGTETTFNTETKEIVTTSFGDRVTDVSLAPYMRSRPVFFQAHRLKPNTRYYAFFDDIDVTAYIAVDQVSTNPGSGEKRYTGVPGRNATFGQQIITDDFGTVSGIFLVPNGRAPVSGAQFVSSINDIELQTSGVSRRFNTGTSTLRLTSSETNSRDEQILEGFCEAQYTAGGVIQDTQETIVSTRIPEVISSTAALETQTREGTTTTTFDAEGNVIVPEPPAPEPTPEPDPEVPVDPPVDPEEPVVIVEPPVEEPEEPPVVVPVEPGPIIITDPIGRPVIISDGDRIAFERPRPRPRITDPVAQTFQVSSVGSSSEGVFVTELEAFFRTKDTREGVEAYLVTTDGQVPTDTVIPHSRVVLQTDTVLRVQCLNLVGDFATISQGSVVTGATSGATGILKFDQVFDSASRNSTTNVNNTVYDVVLNNYVGEFLPGEALVPLTTPANRSVFRIVRDTVQVTRVDLKNAGSGYTTASVSFSAPELPGGESATATCKVAEGIVYDIQLTSPGSGYIKAPTVSITGDGSGAVAQIRYNENGDAVKMGVCTSEDATAATKFKFEAPVYLQPGTWYALVLKSPNSLEYRAWCAKHGENLVGTNRRLVEQTSSGAMFKSQNGGLWTEDQTQDLKFGLKRANFDVTTPGIVRLSNTPLEIKATKSTDPISVSAEGVDVTSRVFGDNPKVARVLHYNHGFNAGDKVRIQGVVGDIGGIPESEFNTLHTVLNADFNHFTIQLPTSATSTTVGGGAAVEVDYQLPFEVSNVVCGVMNFGSTGIQMLQTNCRAPGNSYNQVLYREFLDPVNDLAGQNGGNDYIDAGVEGVDAEIVDRFYEKNYDIETPVTIPLQKNKYWNTPKQIASPINEAVNRNSLGGDRSMTVGVIMTSTSPYVSPVLDLDRTNITVTKNLCDNPKADEERFGVNFKTVTFASDITAAGLVVGDLVSFTASDNVNYTVTVKRVDNASGQVDLMGSKVYKLKLDSVLDNATLAGIGMESMSVERGNNWVGETSPEGSAYSKWVSRLFTFENPCDGLDIKLTTCQYRRSDVRVYYRPRPVGFSGDMNQQKWKGVELENGLPFNWEKIQVRKSENLDPDQIGNAEWRQTTWKTQDQPKFDAVQIKIVMLCSNPAKAPLIADMQVIASE